MTSIVERHSGPCRQRPRTIAERLPTDTDSLPTTEPAGIDVERRRDGTK
jgi:hypothetical protein